MSKHRVNILLSFLIFLGLVAPVALGQQGAPAPAGKGKLTQVLIDAPSLKGNMLGDPARQNISVYIPPGYEASPDKRYPVIYLLHGFGGNDESLLGPNGFDAAAVLDKLIANRSIREVIVVAATGRNAYGGGFYVNSPVTGNWEDHIYKDVVGYVDSNYRTIARASSRGVAGHSMGGFGAVSLGMRHPNVFSSVYAMSPCCLGLDPDFSEPNPGWKQVSQLTSVSGLPTPPRSIEDFFQHVFLALSAAFSPNSNAKPLYSDFLFREEGGKLQQDGAVAAKWKSKMPVYLVDTYKPNLLSLRGIYLDYGEKEEFLHIRRAATLFSKALADRDIPHGFEVYPDGNHVNKVRQRFETRVFRFFDERLDFTEP